MKTNPTSHHNSSGTQQNDTNLYNNAETDYLRGWRDLIDFAENNRFPKLPGLDTTVVSELFSQTPAVAKPKRKNFINKSEKRPE